MFCICICELNCIRLLVVAAKQLYYILLLNISFIFRGKCRSIDPTQSAAIN